MATHNDFDPTKIAEQIARNNARIAELKAALKANKVALFCATKTTPAQQEEAQVYSPEREYALKFVAASNAAENQGDQIAFLTHFAKVGFPPYRQGQPVGEQWEAARRIALRVINPPTSTSEPYRRGSAAPTVAGYVAGLPDPVALQRASLLGQERQLVADLVTATQSRADGIVKSIEKTLATVRQALREVGVER